MRRPIAPAALLLLVVLAGCGGTSGHDMSPREQQLKEQALNATASVDSYSLRASVRVTAKDRDAELEMEMRGVVDRADRRARVRIDVSGATQASQTVYIVNDTAYLKVDGTWRTRDVSDRGIWKRNARLQRQREVLRNATFEIRGNDTIDGERVHVTRIHVPSDEVEEVAAVAGTGTAAEFQVSDVTYTSYLDAETGRPRKVDLEMAMTREGEQYDAEVSMQFSDFGESVTVRVPQAARNATAAG